MNRAARMTTTSAGITIGCAYVQPPPREIGQHAEVIQTLMLAKPRRKGHPVLRWIVASAVSVIAFFVIVGVRP